MSRQSVGLVLGAVLALVLLLLVLLGALGGRWVGAPSPSPTGAAASPTVSPTSTGSPVTVASPTATTATSPSPGTAGTSPDHAYIVGMQPGQFAIRAETDGRIVRGLTGIHPVASPDGRTIAYWKTGPAGAPPHTLTLHTVATGAERALFPATGRQGARIVWANDGTGLLFAVETPRSGGPPSGPARSELFTWDLNAAQAPGGTSSESWLTDGRFWIPVAWDRSGQIASAVTTGEGGFVVEYVTWDMRTQPAGASALKFTQFPWRGLIAEEVRSSSVGTLVSIPDRQANALRVWPTNDIGRAAEIRRSGGAAIVNAEWRPGTTHEAALVVGQTVEVFLYQTDSFRTIHRSAGMPRLVTWRADGSAIVVHESDRTVVVDYASGQATPLPWAAVTNLIMDAVLLR